MIDVTILSFISRFPKPAVEIGYPPALARPPTRMSKKVGCGLHARIDAIEKLVHAAGSTWRVVREALTRDKEMEQQGESPELRLRSMASSTESVKEWMKQIRMALDHWSIREVAKDLAVDDRAAFLMVVLTLESITNIVSQRLSQNIRPRDRLKEQDKALSSVHKYLSHFAADLAEAYAKDAGV